MKYLLKILILFLFISIVNEGNGQTIPCTNTSPCNLITNPFLTYCRMPLTRKDPNDFYPYRIDPINPWQPQQFFDPWKSTHGSPHAG